MHPPGEGRIRTTRSFTAREGGGEYNVSRALRRGFGLRRAVVTALADNPVGRLVEDMVQQGGVDTSHIRWVPYDLNYRPSLWKAVGGQPRVQEVNRALAPFVDVMIGNEEDFTASLGFEMPGTDAHLTELPAENLREMIGDPGPGRWRRQFRVWPHLRAARPGEPAASRLTRVACTPTSARRTTGQSTDRMLRTSNEPSRHTTVANR